MQGSYGVSTKEHQDDGEESGSAGKQVVGEDIAVQEQGLNMMDRRTGFKT